MQKNKVEIPYGRGCIRLNIPVPVKIYSPPDISKIDNFKIKKIIIESGMQEYLKNCKSVLLLIPDKSRDAGIRTILPSIIPLLKNIDVLILVGGGIHSSMTGNELKKHIGESAEKIKVVFHDPDNENLLKSVGESPLGNNITVSKYLFEYDGIILVSSVNFHYFAGFGGGAKLIMPGCAGRKSIEDNHKMVLDYPDLRAGVIKGNPLQREFRFAAKFFDKKIFAIQTVIQNGDILFLSCGHLSRSFSDSCGFLKKNFIMRINNPSDIVLASAGGYPYDINLIQSHKGLEHASMACKGDGTIIYFAKCVDGIGSKQFLPWFDYFADLNVWKRNLKDSYQINGQTAFRWAQKSKGFKIYFYSDIDDKTIKKMGMIPVKSAEEISKIIKKSKNPASIFPFSGHVLPVQKNLFCNFR